MCGSCSTHGREKLI